MGNAARLLPEGAEDLRRRYLRGEASMFVLHGNVYDSQVVDKKLVTLTDFLADVLFKETRDTIAIYNVATGVRFTKRAPTVTGLEDLLLGPKDRVLGALERLLIQSTRAAVIFEYAEALAPTCDPKPAFISLPYHLFRGNNSSDAAPFLGAGIPTADIQAPSYTTDYHTNLDRINVVNASVQQYAGSQVLAMIRTLGNQPDSEMRSPDETYFPMLGRLVHYIPYPVIGGFLAGTGWLLVQGSFGVMTGTPLAFANLEKLINQIR